ncbi:MAG: MFS transporter [Bdellovibrionales bacterium]|nr:MFS transporter [Bdellovibrionales bacterium]
MKKWMSRPVISWAMYDWGNSAFATTVVAAFFPIFYKKYWSAGLEATESTFYLGTTMSIAALLFAMVAPFLGSIGDIKGWQKRGLVAFALFGACCCGLFFFIPQGQWQGALLVYGLSWLGFTGGNLFYDSLLVSVTDSKHYNVVSGLGYGLGYLGGGLLVVVNAMMVTQPAMFGLESPAEGVRWAFLSVGVWWLVFTIPLIIYVREVKATPNGQDALSGVREVLKTLSKVRENKAIFIFLIAYFFYIDGVHTIYKMAVDFALSIGMESSDLIKAIVLVQFVGFPATIAMSYLAHKIGTRKGIFLGLFVYCLVCSVGAFIQTPTHFFILATALGLVQGGVQALSRSLFGQMIPHEHAAEYYGFYNMFGKFSAVLGPFLVGLTSLMFHSPRLSLLAILVLFIIGMVLLAKVPLEKEHS